MNKENDEVIVQSFVDAIPPLERKALIFELKSFVDRHACHHRPIALVSSGGTVADLEIKSVRCIDNFSTGKRGAISVEEFLKRGYAVIHLWRRGSASPYGRVLSNSIMGASSTPNQGISISSLGKLFATCDMEEDQEDQLVQFVLDSQSNLNGHNNNAKNRHKCSKPFFKNGIQLHRRIINSRPLRSALIERGTALEEGRILTIPFRSVEDYLAKLQLSSKALRDTQAMAVVFLCAAVSDFYVPISERSDHKIQSHDVSNQNSNNNDLFSKNIESDHLNLKLWSVPKTMGLLRRKWAPNAFLCSFKLETDKNLLRKKSKGAIERYGCHMVIGNILKTRHDQIWILAPSSMDYSMHDDNSNWKVQDWPTKEISRPKNSKDDDALEAAIMEHVIQSHFEYISTSNSGNLDTSGTSYVVRAHIGIERKRREAEKELFWKEVKNTVLDLAGIFVGAALSFTISTALKRRLNSYQK